jgi:hypothetical protein
VSGGGDATSTIGSGATFPAAGAAGKARGTAEQRPFGSGFEAGPGKSCTRHDATGPIWLADASIGPQAHVIATRQRLPAK